MPKFLIVVLLFFAQASLAASFDPENFLDSTAHLEFSQAQFCQFPVRACTRACTDQACTQECVEASKCQDVKVHGSGVFLSKDLVLTAYHNIDGHLGSAEDAMNQVLSKILPQQRGHWIFPHEFQQVLADGSPMPSGADWPAISLVSIFARNQDKAFVVEDVLWKDKDHDLAILKLRAHSDATLPKIRPVVFGSLKEIQLLDRLIGVGSPGGYRWIISSGELTNKSLSIPHVCKQGCFTHSIPAGHGNSGGPIFSDQGKLVGIFIGSFVNPVTNNPIPSLAYGISIDRIKEIFQDQDKQDLLEKF